MKKHTNNQGYSLTELIIVIAVMAMLAALLAPSIIKYIDKSQNSRAVNSCKQIYTAAMDEIVTNVAAEGDISSTNATWDSIVDKAGKFHDVDIRIIQIIQAANSDAITDLTIYDRGKYVTYSVASNTYSVSNTNPTLDSTTPTNTVEYAGGPVESSGAPASSAPEATPVTTPVTFFASLGESSGSESNDNAAVAEEEKKNEVIDHNPTVFTPIVPQTEEQESTPVENIQYTVAEVENPKIEKVYTENEIVTNSIATAMDSVTTDYIVPYLGGENGQIAYMYVNEKNGMPELKKVFSYKNSASSSKPSQCSSTQLRSQSGEFEAALIAASEGTNYRIVSCALFFDRNGYLVANTNNSKEGIGGQGVTTFITFYHTTFPTSNESAYTTYYYDEDLGWVEGPVKHSVK